MTDNLAYALQPNMAAIGSRNDGSAFSFDTGDYHADNTSNIMNWNTTEIDGNWYYNWYVATAGEGGSAATNTDTDGSICPAGWRISPDYTISRTKSFVALLSNYGIASPAQHSTTSEYKILEALPLTLTRMGSTYNNIISNPSYGYWWTSTAGSNANGAHSICFGSDAADYTSPRGKSSGFSVRCVAL